MQWDLLTTNMKKEMRARERGGRESPRKVQSRTRERGGAKPIPEPSVTPGPESRKKSSDIGVMGPSDNEYAKKKCALAKGGGGEPSEIFTSRTRERGWAKQYQSPNHGKNSVIGIMGPPENEYKNKNARSRKGAEESSRKVHVTHARKRIRQGSIIYSDSWAAYHLIGNLVYTHFQVNHSQNFVDPTNSSIHTQTIERLWGSIK